MTIERAASHYDAVTEAWRRFVMGDDLHFGLFPSGRESLAEATHNLTVQLAAYAELAPGMRVLDVGCGVGTPSLYLAGERGCQVTGISTSAVGLELARARAAERGLADRARFELRDATDNRLPSESFDRVYSLESTHLMPDKDALFRECLRVLEPGGKLALCDVVMVGTVEADLAGYAVLGHTGAVADRMREAVSNTMHRAFGSSMLPDATAYRDAAIRAGFADVTMRDVSNATRATLHHWAKNASDNHAALTAAMGAAYVEDLFLALLHMSFGWGRLGGYVFLTGVKPSPARASRRARP